MSALTKTYRAQVTQNFLQMNTKIEWSAFPLRLPQSNDPSFAAGLALFFSFIILLGRIHLLVGDITEAIRFTWLVMVIVVISLVWGLRRK